MKKSISYDPVRGKRVTFYRGYRITEQHRPETDPEDGCREFVIAQSKHVIGFEWTFDAALSSIDSLVSL